MIEDKLKKIESIVSFIAEVDGLKGVLRRTSPIAMDRRENSAEHSWQVVLTALLLSEFSNEAIDLLRVVKMLSIHDVVELDVGDTFHYEKSDKLDLAEKEAAAAHRIFALLPEPLSTEYRELWEEFEARQTAESKFASAVDRLMAFILNSRNSGGTWKEYLLSANQVIEKNKHVRAGSETLWEFLQIQIDEAVSNGYLQS